MNISSCGIALSDLTELRVLEEASIYNSIQIISLHVTVK